MSAAALDAALLDAHARDDRTALVTLYRQAADLASGEVARGFYLTHAYVFALETGSDMAPALHAELCDLGREA